MLWYLDHLYYAVTNYFYNNDCTKDTKFQKVRTVIMPTIKQLKIEFKKRIILLN